MEQKEFVDGTWTKQERYLMWLCSIPGLYCKQMYTLLKYFEAARNIWTAPESEFEVWRKKQVQWIDILLDFRKKYSPEEVCHRVEKKGIKFISRYHPDFPERLKQLSDCPVGLFFKGRLPADGVLSVAIVGARQCSNYGKTMAKELAEVLAMEGVQIISGLADGIDGYAQDAAVNAGGKSFGILGCGVDICYPKENFQIYQKVWTSGGILSEFPVGMEPERYHFPMRNRLISGLSDAVIVVEARAKSGSLITADLALEQGKEVFAVPGRMKDSLSYGCNWLIEQGARLVLSSENLLKQLNIFTENRKNIKNSVRENQIGLAPEEKWVYSNLDLSPKSLEEIVLKTDVPTVKLCGILLHLELQGLVAEVAKNQYVRLR